MKKKLYQSCNVLFLALFFLITLNMIVQSHSLLRFLGAIGIILLCLLGSYLLAKHGDLVLRNEKWMVSFIFFFYFILQLICMQYIAVKPSWDFGQIYANPISLLSTSQLSNPEYLAEFPNNLFLVFVIYIIDGLASLFHITNFLAVGIVFNIIMIDLAIYFLYLTVNRLYNKKMGFFVLLLCFFITPFFTYVPIFYSDTLTMLFPILALYCYTVFIQKDQEWNRKNILLWIIIITAILMGMQIKFTVIIMLIAILIDYFFRVRTTTWKKFLPLIVAVFGIVFLGFHSLQSYLVYKWDIDLNEQIPYTHWIMMGLVHDGGYDKTEYRYTRTFHTKEEKTKANIDMIKSRLGAYGPAGYLKFLNHKLAVTWNDGTYYAPEKLRRFPLSANNIVYQTFSNQGRYYKYYSGVANAIHLVLLLLIMGSTVLTLYHRQADVVSVCRLAVMGLTIFLLLWETRSRYLVQFLPLIIVCALPIIDQTMKYIINLLKIRREEHETTTNIFRTDFSEDQTLVKS